MFKKYGKIFIVVFMLFLLFFLSYAFRQRNNMLATYNDGIAEINNGNYEKAIEILERLGDYKDSIDLVQNAQELEKQKKIEREKEKIEKQYNAATELFNEGDFEDAIELFSQIPDYKDSNAYIEKAKKLKLQKEADESLYDKAYESYESGDYIMAIQKFSQLNGYEDSDEILYNCRKGLARLQHANTISAGIRSSVGMDRHGKVYLSGNDEYSWRPEIESWRDIVSVCVKGNFVVGLKGDGTVVMAGKIPEYYVGTGTWNDIIEIDTGQQYIVGLHADGTLVAQGHNGDDQVDIDDWKNIIDIAAGWRHTAGIDSNGEIYITGYGSKTQLSEINKHKSDWTDIVSIDAGGGNPGEMAFTPYTVALKADGTVVTTLTGDAADNVREWSDIIAVSAGDFHIVGLKSDGTVVTTQHGESADEIKEWKGIVAISAGYGFTLGLKADGTVVAAGYDNEGQIDVGSWTDIVNYEEEWESIFDKELQWTL